MKLIRPTTLTDAMLTSSTAPENDYAVWASGTAYAVGSRVILTSTHRKYEALAASTGVNPAAFGALPARSVFCRKASTKPMF